MPPARKRGRLQTWADAVWLSKYFDFTLFALSVAGCAFWYFNVPATGKAVAALAVVAAVLTFRPELGSVKKAAFTLLLPAFFYVELRAINRASDEQKEQFGILVERANASIARQESLATHTVNTITGGDSFCYLQISADRKLMTFVRKGDDPLYDVNAVIMSQSDLKRVLQKNPPSYEEMNAIQHPFPIGNFGAQAAIVLKNVLKFPLAGDAGFTIHFNGRNGFWNQYLLVHKTERGLAFASQVTRQTNAGEHPIFEEIAPEFPKPVDWRTLR
jgi:hypothetical protein